MARFRKHVQTEREQELRVNLRTDLNFELHKSSRSTT